MNSTTHANKTYPPVFGMAMMDVLSILKEDGYTSTLEAARKTKLGLGLARKALEELVSVGLAHQKKGIGFMRIRKAR